MSKKLLSEAQVRKFMGLANLDANLSSNFLNEMYGKDHEKEMEEGVYNEEEMNEKMHDDEKKMEEEVVNEKEEMEMDAEADMEMPDEADAAPEGGEDLGDADEPDVDLEEEDVELIVKAAELITQKFGGKVGAMDDMPADEPEMEMDDADMMQEVELQLSEDEIVQEVAKRVAKRINEAARAQKKADSLLGRDKK